MTKDNPYDIDVPEGSNIYAILLFAWIIVAALNKYDPHYWIYNGIMLLACIFAVINQLQGKFTANNFKNGLAGIYVAFWAGLSLFTSPTRIVSVMNFSLTQKTLNGLAILPIILIWMYPARRDRFFGIQKIEREEVISSVWRINVLLLFAIYFLNLWTWLEFLILIPIIYEPIALQVENKDRMPILTLQIQQELMQKFAVPISLAKSFFFIQFAYLFGFLQSKLWILNMMLLILTGFIWTIATFATKLQLDEIDDLDEIFEDETEDEQMSKTDSLATYTDKELAIKEKERPKGRKNKKSKSKAHQLGAKLREELKKPQYNLNHILSTLTQEQFTNGFKVAQDGLKFHSKEGEWSPPKNLVLFPIELGKYDYRREDEILLLGFNKPAPIGKSKFNLTINNHEQHKSHRKHREKREITAYKKEHQYSLGSDRVQFGDTIFNLKTLIVTRRQWQEIQQKLEPITNITDISYTGFKNLADLQEKIIMIGDKWIELRKKAQNMAMEFLQGLLGTGDAVFMDAKALEAEKHALNASRDYEIIEDDNRSIGNIEEDTEQ